MHHEQLLTASSVVTGVSIFLQAVQEFLGYKTRKWPFAVYTLLVVLTGGSIWVIGHFFPRTLLWTLAKCPLGHAHYVQAKVLVCVATF